MTKRSDVYGRLREVDEGWRLEFTRRLSHPQEKVWRALTDPEELVAWFPTTVEGQRTRGAPLRFAFPSGNMPPLDGEMIAFAPPRLLEFRWGDDDVLRFELRPDGDGTLLAFAHTFVEGGKATHDGAGWHECFELLGYLLDGQTPPFEEGLRWAQVKPWYEEQFGPEASRLGPPEHHW
jgi:uncharacterized protein YndB with AHSA1/START domain